MVFNGKKIYGSNIVIIFCMLLSIPYTLAFSYESTQKIEAIAKEFITRTVELRPDETMEIKINPSNSLLQVPACSTEIMASLPKNAGKDQLSSVELSCHGNLAWNIFLPVEIDVYTKVIVAKHTIAPRETITANDVDLISYNKNRLYNGYFVNAEEVIGNETAHLITAGTVLTKKNIQFPLLVHKNQVVNLTSQSNSVIVSMQGIAKEDGALNTTIKIYNPSSKRIIEATVIGLNKVQVTT